MRLWEIPMVRAEVISDPRRAWNYGQEGGSCYNPGKTHGARRRMTTQTRMAQATELKA